MIYIIAQLCHIREIKLMTYIEIFEMIQHIKLIKSQLGFHNFII